MKAVSLKFGQGNSDSTATQSREAEGVPGESTTPVPVPPPLPITSPVGSTVHQNNGNDPHFASGSSTQILSEVLQLARKDGFSDLQLQPGRPIYGNNGGSTP